MTTTIAISENLEVETPRAQNTPTGQLEQAQVLLSIEAEIAKLPPRQREAFLMRYWEDMDVAETAWPWLFGRQRQDTLLAGHACWRAR